jgi:hypothetical protein
MGRTSPFSGSRGGKVRSRRYPVTNEPRRERLLTTHLRQAEGVKHADSRVVSQIDPLRTFGPANQLETTATPLLRMGFMQL